MKVLCYGDSNTYGFDPRSYLGDRYGADCRWVDILARKTNCDVINAGQNGREILHQSIILPNDVDLLIVMLGTNDLLQGRSADIVADSMESFLHKMSIDKEKLLLIAPPPMRLGEWVSDQRLIYQSVQLAMYYETIANRFGILFADAGKWNVDMSFDGVHFSEKGHQAFAEGLYLYLINKKNAP